MQTLGFVGTAVGQDASGQHTLQIYLEQDAPGLRAQLPPMIEDLRTKIIVSGTIEAH